MSAAAVMEARGVPSVEDLTREYRAKLTEAARASYTNDDLIGAWLKACDAEMVEETIGGLRNRSKHLLAYLQEKGLHLLDLDRESTQRYAKWLKTANYEGRRKKDLRAHTVLTHIKAGSSLFTWLVNERGLAVTNPFYATGKTFKRKHRAELTSKLRALDENETGTLLEGAESVEDFLVVLIPFKTGARREEIAGIRMAAIDWNARTIALEPHPKRTFLKLYFDEELEYFLRLKCERNRRDNAGNPYLFPSPRGIGRHVDAATLATWLKRVLRKSPLQATVTDKDSDVTMHTGRRSFTSVLKRARPSAPSGVPAHIVAILRGDSLTSRNENVQDPTQGIYTRTGKVEGIDEVRWWYDRGMPKVGAREQWARVMPTTKTAVSVAGLIRAAKAGVA
jgi:integrase